MGWGTDHPTLWPVTGWLFTVSPVQTSPPRPTTVTGGTTWEDPATLSRVGQRLACVPQPMPNAPQMGFKSSAENLLEDAKMPPPLPPLKPEWRTHMRTAQQLNGESEEQCEEAIPSDSLYGVGGGAPWRDTRPPQARPKPNLGDMSHWSSHGYLAKGGEELEAHPGSWAQPLGQSWQRQ